MKIVECRYCGREIPFDSTLCPYCGKVFNKFQNLIDVQKRKQMNMAKISETKMELIRNSFKPIKLRMSNIRQSGQLNDSNGSYKSKLVKYFLIFSMFITLLVIIVVAIG